MDKKDFFYELPKHLIAQQPIKQRDGSRLMHLNRKTGEIAHKMFREIKDLLKPGDCLVVNDSRVIPARLMSDATEGINPVEMLLHEGVSDGRWTALVKPGKKAREGDILTFGGGRLTAKIEEIIEDGLRVVSFQHEGEFEQILMDIGEMPLPHYIEQKQEDDSRYQTVYAKHDGSVAAPTAGLHFTEELLQEIRDMGVNIATVTLHVGIGTFRPVKEDDITRHHMHSEYCRIEPEVAQLINQTKANGGRVIAIGTTSCRTLESRADGKGGVTAGAGKTDIFIYPGYSFQVLDGLFTNFHLPESTLIMLVSAFASREHVLAAYNAAVKEEYRFFSFGDAMILLD
ncbi:MAG: tRNA preQ1(34) S-adenosylmethionine ribosyltransferase-isomerase QueA [Defluviitaleaceae bacterium]|nr:tRNA preQ1(34) S-adenosylmethionine ribosyltransferase-isomerase QueA [Defluviitaleaceae bacterium]